MPRELALRLARALQAVRILRRYDLTVLRQTYSARADITHRLNVRAYTAAKQCALAQHHTQLGNGRAGLLFRVLVRMPTPLFAALAGREWFVERTRIPSCARQCSPGSASISQRVAARGRR